jgi:hypothetical protein
MTIIHDLLRLRRNERASKIAAVKGSQKSPDKAKGRRGIFYPIRPYRPANARAWPLVSL